jgi:hypothetical protein
MRSVERLTSDARVPASPKKRSPDRQTIAPYAFLVAAQRQAGNQAVDLALQRQTATGVPGFDLAELQVKGHTSGAGAIAVQRQASPPPIKLSTTAVIFKEPDIIRKPSSEIVAEHGRKGIAGWTTPFYEIKFPVVKDNEIQVDTVISFKMEMDNTYRGGFLSVLQDHEQGHVRIAQEKAKATFGDQLGNALQAMPDYKQRKPIADARDAAVAAFSTQEGAASKAYDDTDYPRMANAYYGVKTPLAKLIAQSTAIRRLTNAMWSLMVLSGKKRLSPTTVATRANAISKARDVLPDDDMDILQYNMGFKGYLGRCSAVVSELRQRSDLDDDAQAHLRDTADVFGDFVWKVDDVLITAGAI